MQEWAADGVNVTFEGHFGSTTAAVAVSGDYAYIGQGQDLVVLDVSSPDSPAELGRVMTPYLVLGVAVSGDYAYVADNDNGLVILRMGAPSTSLKGDLNHDGYITPADAVIALQIAVGSRPFDDAADVSRDGRVTSLDALMLLQAAGGAIEL